MKMNYFVVGVNDMDAAVAFYNALFEGGEMIQVPSTDRMTYWLGADFAFAVALPFDGQEARPGNGTMVGFGVDSVDDVKRLHSKAIELGGADEGTPGPRGPRYSAYARDLDGNKLCFFENSA